MVVHETSNGRFKFPVVVSQDNDKDTKVSIVLHEGLELYIDDCILYEVNNESMLRLLKTVLEKLDLS